MLSDEDSEQRMIQNVVDVWDTIYIIINLENISFDVYAF